MLAVETEAGVTRLSKVSERFGQCLMQVAFNCEDLGAKLGLRSGLHAIFLIFRCRNTLISVKNLTLVLALDACRETRLAVTGRLLAKSDLLVTYAHVPIWIAARFADDSPRMCRPCDVQRQTFWLFG